MRFPKSILYSAFCLVLTAAFSSAAPPPPPGPVVRVALLQDAHEVRVTAAARCRLSGTQIEWPSLKWQKVQPGPDGIVIGGTRTGSRSVTLETAPGALLRVNSKPYRGALTFLQTGPASITVINRLPLEEYLVGALASEVSHGWPQETLRAHAIVSRTMVAHRIWIQRDKPFDVTADTSTHVYHGASAERAGTQAAVRDTAGQVLAYGGELLSASFHSNCGGHTEEAALLWPGSPSIPPLKGRPDPHCRNLKHFRWHAEIPEQQLLEALGPRARFLKKIVSCDASEKDPSGRVRNVRIRGEGGELVLSGRDFRQLLGANRLRSLNFTAVVSRHLVFDGYGWGHGVGMCQWGAYGMAKQGRTWHEILEFYFPGAQHRRLAGLPGFPIT